MTKKISIIVVFLLPWHLGKLWTEMLVHCMLWKQDKSLCHCSMKIVIEIIFTEMFQLF